MKPKQYEQFIQCQPKLYRFAYSLVKHVGDAEDIFQDTLVKIWELKEEWDNWTNFEAYAMRMIRNNFLNFEKRKKSRFYVGLEDVVEVPEPNEIEQGITTDDLQYKFKLLTRKLPEVQQNILFLREIEELEYKEIAEILDLTDAQVKMYLFRARQYLKSKVHGKR
ncbi:RNA polymerase sigma factor [Pedobacter sp. UBA5917]|jgi:RNA polymerase sigma-70 factor (ECF subfamily)|uniref:RNA polymerase sigma factor n=1 Tax=Pedobacter sp. UBA5917 TaxID=1947061 RepID=UPI0025E6B392|nr:sigma-70 family RNA polymerase sigma factor [Pedobacter sp. UBA5917]